MVNRNEAGRMAVRWFGSVAWPRPRRVWLPVARRFPAAAASGVVVPGRKTGAVRIGVPCIRGIYRVHRMIIKYTVYTRGLETQTPLYRSGLERDENAGRNRDESRERERGERAQREGERAKRGEREAD